MRDKDKTKAELIAELKEMRRLVSDLEKSESMLKQATEESLKHEAIRRRILVEQSRDGIVVIDQSGKVYEANQRYADMLGYSMDEVSQLYVWDWDVQWTQEQLLEKIRTIDDTGDQFETRHRRKDGTFYDVEISTNGAVYGGQKLVFCVCRDITERKRAEEALRESEARLQALSDASFEAIFFSDKGVCIDQNRAAERIFGYSYKEAIGRHGTQWISPEDRDQVKNNMLSGHEKPYEVTALRKDGTTFPAEIQVRTFEYKGRPVRVTALRDNTDRKRTEEALRESEARFRTLFKEVPAALQGYDPEGTIFYWNKASEVVYGYKSEEAIGRNLVDLIIPAEMRDNVAAAIKRGAETGEMPPPEEHWLINKDGSFVPVLSSHVVIKSDSKKPELYRLDVDLAEQKRLQFQLQQAQKMEAIGTLTGGVAHDFNNILGIIIGNADLALDDVPSWNPTHFNLEEIKSAALRAKDIVRQLLTFSRNVEPEKNILNLIPILKDTLRFLRATIPATIDIRQKIRAADETIMADPTQIHQLIVNLCVNASQAMEETGGVLTVGLERVTLNADSADVYPDLSTGDYVKLTISDTGPGIVPEIQNRVFDPYFTTRDVGKGSGLGLSVAHGIVKNHNGAISVDSKPGKGATFTVLFPLAAKKIERQVETIEKISTGKETILLVDDEESIVTMGRQMLERLGYTVETATTPQDALELFRSNPDHFDLVITDMTMPQKTGTALFEEIKKIRKDIPVMVTTGHSSLIDNKKAKEIGLAAYVMKPFNKREIASAIRKALN